MHELECIAARSGSGRTARWSNIAQLERPARIRLPAFYKGRVDACGVCNTVRGIDQCGEEKKKGVIVDAAFAAPPLDARSDGVDAGCVLWREVHPAVFAAAVSGRRKVRMDEARLRIHAVQVLDRGAHSGTLAETAQVGQRGYTIGCDVRAAEHIRVLHQIRRMNVKSAPFERAGNTRGAAERIYSGTTNDAALAQHLRDETKKSRFIADVTHKSEYTRVHIASPSSS